MCTAQLRIHLPIIQYGNGDDDVSLGILYVRHPRGFKMFAWFSLGFSSLSSVHVRSFDDITTHFAEDAGKG